MMIDILLGAGWKVLLFFLFFKKHINNLYRNVVRGGHLVKIAINGFGRIGRVVLRHALNNKDFEFVALNDLTDAKTLAHLLKYDSVHGVLTNNISSDEKGLIIDGKHIPIFSEKDPSKLPWKQLGVEIVIDCTGKFLTKETASMHLKAGAKKVILSAPAKEKDIFTFVMGVNEHSYAGEDIVSNASCTTNCFAPIAKVLHDNYVIEKGNMITIHGYTADQRIQDSPHRDLRRARAAALNMVPTSSGAAKAVQLVIPELNGKINSSAIRVPIIDGSIAIFSAIINKEASIDEINNLFENVSKHHMKGILQYTTDPIVSSDIIGNTHSSIYDAGLTEVNGNMIKVAAWYDNEVGYSCRILDVINYIKNKV